eukprot:GHVL01031287.1.p1 GENE.GHVL01031287.1~~GHVL01031287.1.p1  ORF type:complete len:343 (+),score=64.56 GHVL01031287.1:535-1563(+)
MIYNIYFLFFFMTTEFGHSNSRFSGLLHRIRNAPNNKNNHFPWSEEQLNKGVILYNYLINNEDHIFRESSIKSLKIIDDTLRVFGPLGVYCSFNGGKDAVVILALYRAALANFLKKNRDDFKKKKKIYLMGRRWSPMELVRPQVIFFYNENDEFPEVVETVQKSAARFDLDMKTFGPDFCEGLDKLADVNKGMPIAFLLGTREGDPNSSQGHFEPTSDWMPPSMRVNPIIEWDYGMIWKMLKDFKLLYPSLYDVGYTSLGTRSMTRRNPALFGVSGSDLITKQEYGPAWALKQWHLERLGRLKKKKPLGPPLGPPPGATPGVSRIQKYLCSREKCKHHYGVK